jgi:hypothetical protein
MVGFIRGLWLYRIAKRKLYELYFLFPADLAFIEPRSKLDAYLPAVRQIGFDVGGILRRLPPISNSRAREHRRCG